MAARFTLWGLRFALWRAGAPRDSCRLDGYLHAAPKGDVPGDVLGGGLWRWVVPGRIFVGLTIHDDVVVARCALPGAHGMSVALAEELALDRVGRKVLIALDDFASVTFRHHGTVPCCFGHGILLSRFSD